MNDRIINQDVFDRYLDATVALFMERYSAALSDSICTEMGKLGNADGIFPASLDKRCRNLIKKECVRRRRTRLLKSTTKGLKYVAIFGVTLLSLASFLFMTVDAFRLSVINYYIELHDGHWEISGSSNSEQDKTKKAIDIANPLADLIPSDYVLVFAEGDSTSDLTAIYENPEGKQIYFCGTVGDSWIAVDSEDAQVSQPLQLCGCEAILVIKGSGVSVTWIHKASSTIFALTADNLTDSDILLIAENFTTNLSK